MAANYKFLLSFVSIKISLTEIQRILLSNEVTAANLNAYKKFFFFGSHL